MKTCSVPLDLKEFPERGFVYLRCGKLAGYRVVDSDWCICSEHVGYAVNSKWPLEKIEEIWYGKDKTKSCRYRSIVRASS